MVNTRFKCVEWISINLSRILEDSNLVDSASSHTLVSKIKPCMSKYKYFTLKLRMAHYISYSLFDNSLTTRITVVILELIRANISDRLER